MAENAVNNEENVNSQSSHRKSGPKHIYAREHKLYCYIRFGFCDIRNNQGLGSGAPNVNFRKISVRKTIWDLEVSEHLL